MKNHESSTGQRASGAHSRRERATNTFPIVGVGASAGGLEAFRELLDHVPAKTGVAFVLVQHLDPTHTSGLREILSRISRIPISEATDGVVLEPDHAYLIPANTDLSIRGGKLYLAARELTRGRHMPINRFLCSLAEDRGERAIGVILSGTATDGTEGCEAIKAAGGIVFAQDEKSAKYPSMPRSAISAGCVDFVMPPARIAAELARIAEHPYVARAALQKEQAAKKAETPDIETLFSLVREATGVDFSHYKQSTLQRRIQRRMVLRHIDKLKDYVRLAKKNPREVEELYRDILIHVTGFFRDPDAFEALRTAVFPKLFKSRRTDDSPVRIWVPGCSTGEEPYSIAMTALEFLWDEARGMPAGFVSRSLQMFATDLSETALSRARAGFYLESAVADVSPERLKRFFERVEGGYRINKNIREMCIFARHNLAKDPPFSNLDLVSCRNLLIYLGPDLQKRVIPALHYALKPDGFLMLGESENLSAFADHFILLDKKNKIYQKKRTAAPLLTYFSSGEYPLQRPGARAPEQHYRVADVEKEVDRVLTEHFVPASIVVNSEMEIVQFRGKTGAYLEPAAGHPTFSLSKMAREGLLVDLRSALSAAKKGNVRVRKEGIRFRSNGGTREVNLEVIPVRAPGTRDRFFIVAFEEPAPAHGVREKGKRERGSMSARDRRRAAEETKELRQQLQALIEDHETTLEEFKAANEEVLSANEELQSTNEELETAKEELQSTNEELTTLNEELHNRNAELTLANNDLVNLIGNANVPVVMLGNDLRIRRYTPPAEKLLNLLPGDVGRRLGEIRPNLEADNLELLAREAIENAVPQELEVREPNHGAWHLLRVRPYKTYENRIEGAVLSFQNIDSLKRDIETIRTYAEALIENAREAILVLDGNLRVTVANRAFYSAFNVSPAETVGRQIYELGNGQWNIPQLRKLLEEVNTQHTRIDDFEVRHDFSGLGPRVMILNSRRIEPRAGATLIFLAIEDVTEKRSHIEALKRQAALLDLAREAVMVRGPSGIVESWSRGAEELYGWTREEALGKSVFELLRSEFPKPLNTIQDELSRGGRWEGEVVQTRRDGTKRVVSSRWALQKAGSGAGAVLQIDSDVTMRKKSEDSLRRLSGRLMRVQDEERRRMALELHDSTGQKLTAVNLALKNLRVRLAGSPRESATLRECMGWVKESMLDIRTISQLLHPPLLEEAGLSSAVRALGNRLSGRSQLRVECAVPDKMRRLPADIELALFRVVQEALNNAVRHSGGTRVKIELSERDGFVAVTVSDDGKGLPPELVSEAENSNADLGVGILGMKERLAQFGGKLEIKNGRKGVIVRAEVPIPAT